MQDDDGADSADNSTLHQPLKDLSIHEGEVCTATAWTLPHEAGQEMMVPMLPVDDWIGIESMHAVCICQARTSSADANVVRYRISPTENTPVFTELWLSQRQSEAPQEQ